MSQSQVWKKRPAELASEFRDQASTRLNPREEYRQVIAMTPAGPEEAGPIRRKFEVKER